MNPGSTLRVCVTWARNRQVRTFVAFVLGLLSAWPAQADVVNCPLSVSAQFRKIAPVAADGASGQIADFERAFVANAQVRLVGAHIAVVHGGGTGFSEVLHPDELVYRPGRPMRWTLWDGRPPEPTEDVLVHCEYEGGLVLYRSLGSKIHQCTLTSAVLSAGPKAAPKAGAKGKAKPAAEPPGPVLPQVREIMTKGSISCR